MKQQGTRDNGTTAQQQQHNGDADGIDGKTITLLFGRMKSGSEHKYLAVAFDSCTIMSNICVRDDGVTLPPGLTATDRTDQVVRSIYFTDFSLPHIPADQPAAWPRFFVTASRPGTIVLTLDRDQPPRPGGGTICLRQPATRPAVIRYAGLAVIGHLFTDPVCGWFLAAQ